MKAPLFSGLLPDADEARRLLEQELAEPAYVEAQPNVFERILADFLRSLARLFDGVTGLGAGTGTILVALGAAVLIIAAILLIRPRLNARGRTSATAVFDDDKRRSAAEHRRRASDCASGGDWNGAVAEILRAIIRSSEERVVIDQQPGRTASEAGVQLGAAFPGRRSEVGWLADHFDETHYGSGRSREEDYRRAATLDEALTSEQPSRASSPMMPAAPR